ncbi:MAG TPA: TlpA disulfide reductase family protein [Candidatus Sulfotelmatobacter sp.]
MAQPSFATSGQKRHYLDMRYRALLVALSISISAWAGIVEDVRGALADNSYTAAQLFLKSYRAKNGVTPEYVEAYSWQARAALSSQDYDQATRFTKETQALIDDQLKTRKLDSEPHLPLALGAVYEVEAQTLVARGQQAQAVTLLRNALRTYGSTSINARLQKNLNLIALQGKAAPGLKADEFLGSKPPILTELKGKPVLLFFWAHWCADCKAEAPIITQLRTEYAPKGLNVVGPTRLYGYTAQVENAAPKDELAYIDAVRRHFYTGLLDMPVPISKYNFDTYGASTTPTLVLLDREGKVAMYHPGALSYDELKAQIEKVVAR